VSKNVIAKEPPRRHAVGNLPAAVGRSAVMTKWNLALSTRVATCERQHFTNTVNDWE
jgi:hypothetical protein